MVSTLIFFFSFALRLIVTWKLVCVKMISVLLYNYHLTNVSFKKGNIYLIMGIMG